MHEADRWGASCMRSRFEEAERFAWHHGDMRGSVGSGVVGGSAPSAHYCRTRSAGETLPHNTPVGGRAMGGPGQREKEEGARVSRPTPIVFVSPAALPVWQKKEMRVPIWPAGVRNQFPA
jgi:hypothetical protein